MARLPADPGGPPLSRAQLARYARHIALPQIGGAGQRRLLGARVLVVGAGGLGAPVCMYLAAAGVGVLGIVDDDHVSLSNLQRQVIHDTASVGRPKVASAAARLAAINPDVTVEPHPVRLDAGNALDLVDAYDLVADGSDTLATRLLVNDACYFAERPLVSAAVGGFTGLLSTFRAFARDARGVPCPSYRCLAPATAGGMEESCADAGILGALTGVMGTLQAMEVIKEITGAGRSLVGRLLIYDALETRVRVIGLPWDPVNPLNGDNPTIGDLSAHREHPRR